MILIITHKEDFTCDFLINKLNQRRIPYYRFNCEDIAKLQYTVDDNFVVTLNGISGFTSAWYRRTKLPNLAHLDDKTKFYLLHEYEALLKNFCSILTVKWLSNPFSIYNAENKLLQLKIAKKIGFLIPPTIWTSVHKKIQNFFAENNDQIIIKPLSKSKISDAKETDFIFTNIVKKEHIDNLSEYDLTPCIYQKEIKKDVEMRVTVVGEKVFTAGINSQFSSETQTDWRKGNPSFFVTNLPIEIEEKCIRLVKALGLKFGAIDLIKSDTGDYFFLEINPNGQWVWIETETGLQISEAIINELV